MNNDVHAASCGKPSPFSCDKNVRFPLHDESKPLVSASSNLAEDWVVGVRSHPATQVALTSYAKTADFQQIRSLEEKNPVTQWKTQSKPAVAKKGKGLRFIGSANNRAGKIKLIDYLKPVQAKRLTTRGLSEEEKLQKSARYYRQRFDAEVQYLDASNPSVKVFVAQFSRLITSTKIYRISMLRKASTTNDKMAFINRCLNYRKRTSTKAE